MACRCSPGNYNVLDWFVCKTSKCQHFVCIKTLKTTKLLYYNIINTITMLHFNSTVWVWEYVGYCIALPMIKCLECVWFQMKTSRTNITKK